MIKISKDFLNIVLDILENPKFQELKVLKHHGSSNTVYEHSIRTAYFAFKFCKEINLKKEDIISTTRATLLHDFFCYDWKLRKPQKFLQKHAFQHGKVAAENADKYFQINENQKDAIKNHMFPLTPWPHHKEGWIVTFADKVISIEEFCQAGIFYFSSRNRKKKILEKNNKIKIRKERH